MPSLGLEIRDVDFTSPGHVEPEDFGLEGLHSAAARLSVDLSPTSGLGASHLGEVRRGDGTAIHAQDTVWFTLSTSAGAGAVLVDPALAVTIADLLLGGSGSTAARALTSVEERVVVPHLRRALEPLNSVFLGTGVEPLRLEAAGRGHLQLRGDTLSFDIGVDAASGELLGVITIVVPSPALVSSGGSSRLPGAKELGANGALARIPLALTLRTDATTFPASAVRGFEVGAVISLAHRCDTPLRVMCGPVEIARAMLGRHESDTTMRVDSLAARTSTSRFRPRRTSRVIASSAPAIPTLEELTDSPAAGSQLEGEADMSESTPEPDAAVAAALAAAQEALDPPLAPPTGTDVIPALDLGLLSDVPVEISVEVGRASISLRDAAALSPGQVVPLDAESGSPATVLVNGRVVARGQVVVVDEVYGVRISDLVEE